MQGSQSLQRHRCRRRTKPARAIAAAAAAACLAAGGCQSIQSELVALHSQGRYEDARKLLEDPHTQHEVYGERDSVLWSLETGAAQFECADYRDAVQTFDEAEKFTAFNYDRTGGEVLAQWTINDSAAAYAAQPYEDIYVNVFKQLSFLKLGDLNNAAAESRRLLDKSKNLGELSSKYLKRLKDEDKSGFVQQSSEGFRPSVEQQGEFVASPLGAYLAAVIAAKNGNAAGIDEAAARLRQAVGEQRQFVGAVNPGAFDSVADLTDASFNVVVVAFSGRGPVKESRQVDMPLSPGQRLDIPFPTMPRRPSSAVVSAKVEFDGAPPGWNAAEGGVGAPAGSPAVGNGASQSPSAGSSHELDFVEDLGRVAAENFARSESVIYTRTVARIGIKAGVVAGAAYGVSRASKGDGWTALTVLAGVGYILLTEHADLRSWVMLPGQARVAALKLPVGPHQARVVYRFADGRTRATAWQAIDVSESGAATVITVDPG